MAFVRRFHNSHRYHYEISDLNTPFLLMHPLIQKLEIQLNKEVEKKCEGIEVTLDLVRQIGPEVTQLQGLKKLSPSVLKKTKITQFFEVRGEQAIGDNER